MMITNDTIDSVERMKDVLDEVNYDLGVDRVAILLDTGHNFENLFFLVCADPDGEWFFLVDEDESGTWEQRKLSELPRFESAHLMAGR